MSAIASDIGGGPDDGSFDANSGRNAPNGLDFGQLGYGIAALLVLFGWIVTRYYQVVDPLNGVGYWLGIVGASSMAVLLLYPMRKRLRKLHFLGETRHWFRAHIFLGVVGPLLILYHCNFQFGSLNSTVALVCTLLVAISGLVGRYIHAKVFSDLDGQRTSHQELIERARISSKDKLHVAALVPELLDRMRRFDAIVMARSSGFWSCVSLPMKLAFTTRIGRWQLSRYARKHIDMQARNSKVIDAQKRRLQRATSKFIVQHLKRVRRVAELNSYERMFSLWHVFHLPFFYMLVLTALVHVLAVHMY